MARLIAGLAVGSRRRSVRAALVSIDGLGLHARPAAIRTSEWPPQGDAAEAQADAVLRLAHAAGQDALSLQAVGVLGPPADADVLAERTGVTAVTDFAARDAAAGGCAAPLTALADLLLFGHPREDRLLIHLGRATSVVALPAGGAVSDVVSFEAAPGGGLLDELMRVWSGGAYELDAGGTHAVQGRRLPGLAERWLGDAFFDRRPPKSLPAVAFGPDFVREAGDTTRAVGGTLQDLACTAAHFVADAVGASCSRWLPARDWSVYYSGGGSRNGMLRRLIDERLRPAASGPLGEVGVPASHRAAAAAAVLAGLLLDGVPADAPHLTGCQGGRLLGRLTPGCAEHWAGCLRWMASHAYDPVPARPLARAA